ncbi:uncharacterized protein [Watersipora subatra]|uniref:uncharacterized protein n=1 Tax=Watersipora subatra TaxID=2589382 RepID=UPI00355B8402
MITLSEVEDEEIDAIEALERRMEERHEDARLYEDETYRMLTDRVERQLDERTRRLEDILESLAVKIDNMDRREPALTSSPLRRFRDNNNDRREPASTRSPLHRIKESREFKVII